MPKSISQYSIFIGSPSGLDDERRKFRVSLEKCSRHHGIEKGALFHPVGWEDTIGGAGRPQELINDDLRQCDYAVFVLHDRWGSPTGSGYSSGTEEEWALAEELYRANKIRNIALFFKQVDPGKIADPGQHLKPVLEFKKRIEEEKRYLFKQYRTIDEFVDTLDGHLAQWLRDYEKAKTGLPLSDQSTRSPAEPMKTQAPNFDYWIKEANKSVTSDNAGALFCASKALDAATSNLEWASAKHSWGAAQFYLGRLDESLLAFSSIVDRFSTSVDGDEGGWHARALFNKGVTLATLGRSGDELAAYDDLVVRFGAATELPLREHVASAIFNKGVHLAALGRSEDEIAEYDEVLARFGSETELPLREHLARALVNNAAFLVLRRDLATGLINKIVCILIRRRLFDVPDD